VLETGERRGANIIGHNCSNKGKDPNKNGRNELQEKSREGDGREVTNSWREGVEVEPGG